MIPDQYKSFTGELWNLVFPRRCAVCRSDATPDGYAEICEDCKSGISPQMGSACLVCGEPIDGSLSTAGIVRCGRCRIKMPPFDKTVFALRYEGTVRSLIHRFKFGGRKGLAGAVIAPMLCARLQRGLEMDRVDLVVPIPLHRARLLKRGFNQSYLLAREIGTTFSLETSTDIIFRKKDTAAQFRQTRAQRWANIRNAFRLYGSEKLKGKRLLLVDDIMTTGATMFEAARILKKGGAKSIACAVAARAAKS